MPNQMSFEVEFTRAQIEGLFSDPAAANLIVSGEYMRAEDGTWATEVTAEVCDSGYVKIPGRSEPSSCIRPCPR